VLATWSVKADFFKMWVSSIQSRLLLSYRKVGKELGEVEVCNASYRAALRVNSRFTYHVSTPFIALVVVLRGHTRSRPLSVLIRPVSPFVSPDISQADISSDGTELHIWVALVSSASVAFVIPERLIVILSNTNMLWAGGLTADPRPVRLCRLFNDDTWYVRG
jgi:hypothetical protein